MRAWLKTYREYLKQYCELEDIADRLKWAKEKAEELEKYLPGVQEAFDKMDVDDMCYVEGLLFEYEKCAR